MTETIDTAALAKRVANWLTMRANAQIMAGVPYEKIIAVFSVEEAQDLSALLRGVVGGPKVKPLEWVGEEWPHYYHARCDLGTYRVGQRHPHGQYWLTRPDGGEFTFHRADTAQAAAQADYEQRIRSALVLPAPPLTKEG